MVNGMNENVQGYNFEFYFEFLQILIILQMLILMLTE